MKFFRSIKEDFYKFLFAKRSLDVKFLRSISNLFLIHPLSQHSHFNHVLLLFIQWKPTIKNSKIFLFSVVNLQKKLQDILNLGWNFKLKIFSKASFFQNNCKYRTENSWKKYGILKIVLFSDFIKGINWFNPLQVFLSLKCLEMKPLLYIYLQFQK